VPRSCPPKNYKVCGEVGCIRTHPAWKCRAFNNIAHEERENIIKDNRMCPFCLLHGIKDICYANISKTKPVCPKTECKGEHNQWLHYILKTKNIINAKAVDLLEEGAVNMITGNDGWMTQDESWLDIEAAEDGEMFFVEVIFEGDRAFADKKKAGRAEDGVETLELKEDYIRSLVSQKDKRKR
jgi:hypothetical protein